MPVNLRLSLKMPVARRYWLSSSFSQVSRRGTFPETCLLLRTCTVLPRQWVVLSSPNHLRSSLISKLASSPTIAHHCIDDSLHRRSGDRRSVSGIRWTPFRSIFIINEAFSHHPVPFTVLSWVHTYQNRHFGCLPGILLISKINDRKAKIMFLSV